MLKAESISFSAGNQTILHPSTVFFAPGKFHVIMGANGAGKSTLMKILAGEQRQDSGTVYFNNRDLQQYSKKELATRRAVLSQHYTITFPITSNEIVMMGRYPYFSSIPTARDISIQQQAMAIMGVTDFGERDYNTLSGGEAQKVQMSRVLAQIWNNGEGKKKLLFLDEPVSHLDIKYQYQLLQVGKDLCQQHVTVIAILHDINLAISFADRILFLKQGSIIHDLNHLSELTTTIVDEVFDIKAKMLFPEGHKPVVIF